MNPSSHHSPGPIIETPRLLLRPWRDEDLPAFAALNADPVVREFFPSVLSRSESDAEADRIRQSLQEKGYGLWAVEIKNGEPFIGHVGLNAPTFEANFTPCVEIGWRLAQAYWGMGYATEAARQVLHFGFHTLNLAEIVSFTVPANQRSRAVMERLGMRHDAADDFDHPRVPIGNQLKRHVLYRLSQTDFKAETDF